MLDEPLSSPQAYEAYIYGLSERYLPPDIKHHRVVAPDLSFARPNLPSLIEEIEREILGKPASG
jgi:hypothetical protein